MENFIKYLPIGLLSAYVCRILIFGTQISDSLVIIALSALIYLMAIVKLNKNALEVQAKIEKLEQDLDKHRQEIQEAKSYVASVKMSTQLRGR